MSIKKGHIIDERCTVKGELVEYNGNIYDCTLNQTEIDANKNKFYIMQLIKNGNSYHHHIRFGRISEVGKVLSTTYNDETSARTAFEKQFRAKTGNVWANKNFVKKPNKYFQSIVSYDDELSKVDIPKQVKIPDSKLPERTQKLVTMLTDIQMLSGALVTLNIDTKKLPLGKINQTQLKLAEKILDQLQQTITNLVKDPNNDTLKSSLVSESSAFYCMLPMSFGRRKPTIIDTDEIVQKYRDTIDELSNIAIAVQITENVKADENPVDAAYKNINTRITPLDKTSNMWKQIDLFCKNTHGSTHDAKLEIIDIFEIEQNGKRKIFEDCCKNIGNNTLLWHGTPQNCVFSIFSKDMYLDPTKLKDVNVQIAGKMFGSNPAQVF